MLRLATHLSTICKICAIRVFYAIWKIWETCAIYVAPKYPRWVQDREVMLYLFPTHALWLRDALPRRYNSKFLVNIPRLGWFSPLFLLCFCCFLHFCDLKVTLKFNNMIVLSFYLYFELTRHLRTLTLHLLTCIPAQKCNLDDCFYVSVTVIISG